MPKRSSVFGEFYDAYLQIDHLPVIDEAEHIDGGQHAFHCWSQKVPSNLWKLQGYRSLKALIYSFSNDNASQTDFLAHTHELNNLKSLVIANIFAPFNIGTLLEHLPDLEHLGFSYATKTNLDVVRHANLKELYAPNGADWLWRCSFPALRSLTLPITNELLTDWQPQQFEQLEHLGLYEQPNTPDIDKATHNFLAIAALPSSCTQFTFYPNWNDEQLQRLSKLAICQAITHLTFHEARFSTPAYLNRQTFPALVYLAISNQEFVMDVVGFVRHLLNAEFPLNDLYLDLSGAELSNDDAQALLSLIAEEPLQGICLDFNFITEPSIVRSYRQLPYPASLKHQGNGEHYFDDLSQWENAAFRYTEQP